jgi:hypothetical protein
VEVEAHPGGREQLRQWCGGMMPGVLPPSNVTLVVEGRQPTPTYQPLGGCARTARHTKAARCPRHCRYLYASTTCIVSCIVMLHLQSKDTTMYVRNLLTSAWKAAGGSIANVSVITTSCGAASTGTGKQRTRVAPWNQCMYSRYVASRIAHQGRAHRWQLVPSR